MLPQRSSRLGNLRDVCRGEAPPPGAEGSSATPRMARGFSALMKLQLLLPMLASLCITSAANSQSPDQPRREPERQPRETPEARKPTPDQPRPEARRDEGQRGESRGLAPRRPESQSRGSRDGERHRMPEARRPQSGDRPDMHRHSPGFAPMPPGPRGGPDALNELREQVRTLTRQVHELREMMEAQRNGMQRLAEQHRSGFHRSFPRGGPKSGSRESQPPKGDAHRGENHSHGDGGPQEKMKPRPPGDRPMPQGDREKHGNPPPR